MAQKRDYYEVLGIQKGAGKDEIKKAYRKLAKQFHPDQNPGDKSAEEKFKEVNEAYSTLSDDEKRNRYDQFGHAGVDETYGAGGFNGYNGFGDFGGVDLGDIFGSFFGGSTSARRTKRGPVRGRDLQESITITFEEAAKGAEKTVNVSRYETCTKCGGSGAKAGSNPETCPTCKGSGEMHSVQRTMLGSFSTVTTCTTCGGEGTILKNPCEQCGGGGLERKSRKINVKIPAGIDNDQVITLRGQGDHGRKGGSPGDLRLHINVRKHSIFKRNGYDVHIEMPITFVEAALGAEIDTPTLYGKVKFKVPAGTQSETNFRLKGKGIQRLGGGGQGDQFVKVIVDVPKNLTDKQKEILKSFGETLGIYELGVRKSFLDKVKDNLGL